jgi:hypothetical protein
LPIALLPSSSVRSGYTAPLAARMRAAVGVPIIVGGRINEPQLVPGCQTNASIMTHYGR